MPSFRASVAVIDTHAATAPAAILDAAREAVQAHWHVEDAFVDVDSLRRGGLPRVTIRFVVPAANDAEEDENAWQAGKALATAVGQLADWHQLQVRRRVKGRWLLLDRRS